MKKIIAIAIAIMLCLCTVCAADYITAGSTDISTYIVLRDNSDGTEEPSLTYASSGLTLAYIRNGEAVVDVNAVAQTVTGSHSDGGFSEVSATYAPGLYRIDWPDAAFADGGRDVTLAVQATGTYAEYQTYQLTDDVNDMADQVWDEQLSEHTSEGSAGATYQNIEKNTAVK